MDRDDHLVCEVRYCPECGTEIFCRNVPDRGLIFYVSEKMDQELERCLSCSLALAGLSLGDLKGKSERAPQKRSPAKKPVGKKALVSAVLEAGSERFSSKADAERAFEAVGEALVGLVGEGKDIRWPGIGTFRIKERKPRRARNPRTGEMMEIPARKVLTFVPAKHLKETVKRIEVKP